MYREAQEKDRLEELIQLNRAFLALLLHPQAPSEGLFGLPAGVRVELAKLDASQLEMVAATPCLLVKPLLESARPQRTAALPESLACEARAFSAAMLTWVWQCARSADSQSLLAAGLEADLRDGFTSLSFLELTLAASRVGDRLTARFCGRADFWPELIDAARSADPGRTERTRLSSIPLAAAVFLLSTTR